MLGESARGVFKLNWGWEGQNMFLKERHWPDSWGMQERLRHLIKLEEEMSLRKWTGITSLRTYIPSYGDGHFSVKKCIGHLRHLWWVQHNYYITVIQDINHSFHLPYNAHVMMLRVLIIENFVVSYHLYLGSCQARFICWIYLFHKLLLITTFNFWFQYRFTSCIFPNQKFVFLLILTYNMKFHGKQPKPCPRVEAQLLRGRLEAQLLRGSLSRKFSKYGIHPGFL